MWQDHWEGRQSYRRDNEGVRGTHRRVQVSKQDETIQHLGCISSFVIFPNHLDHIFGFALCSSLCGDSAFLSRPAVQVVVQYRLPTDSEIDGFIVPTKMSGFKSRLRAYLLNHTG